MVVSFDESGPWRKTGFRAGVVSRGGDRLSLKCL